MRKYQFFLHADVADAILQASSDRDVDLNKALNEIVREWIEYKKIDDLPADLQKALGNIDKRLRVLELFYQYELLRQKLGR